MRKKLTIIHSIIWIFSSIFIVNSLGYLCIKGYQHWKSKRQIDPNTTIKAIIQTGPQKGALKTSYLAEILNLSADYPSLSKGFDLKKARKKLLSSPVIKKVEVKFAGPEILYIDYTTRQPVALLYDYKNTALDQEGCPFPLVPFFSPKKLPEIYLGMNEDLRFNQPIEGEKINLAFDLLKILTGPIIDGFFNVRRIDISNAFKESFGKREIIVRVADESFVMQDGKEVCFIFPRLLRLSTKHYTQELGNYLKLREKLLDKEKKQLIFPEGEEKLVMCREKVIDFRIPQLAFIE